MILIECYAIYKDNLSSRGIFVITVLLIDFLKITIQDEDSIELVGLCTDICVVPNAFLLKTNFPEIPESVDAGCCAGVTVSSHQAALKTMEMCQVQIIGND